MNTFASIFGSNMGMSDYGLAGRLLMVPKTDRGIIHAWILEYSIPQPINIRGRWDDSASWDDSNVWYD